MGVEQKLCVISVLLEEKLQKKNKCINFSLQNSYTAHHTFEKEFFSSTGALFLNLEKNLFIIDRVLFREFIAF
jgi:hypothetical protein